MNINIRKLSVYLGAIILFLTLSQSTFAQIGPAQKVQVTASVEPKRIIVVNSDSKILSIVSNSSKEVEPTVVLNTANGEEVVYSEIIKKEFENLTQSLSFENPGIIYSYTEESEDSFIKMSALKIAKLLNFSI